MLAIGLMSGTSLDGVDVCLVSIEETKTGFTYTEKKFFFVPYTKELKQKIQEVSHLETSNVQKICSLHFELGYVYKEAVQKLLDVEQLDSTALSFIAMHGQTIWHNPNQMDGYFSSTLQIGEPSVLAYAFDTTIIHDFRVMDMVAGGNGAPLVPFVNYVLHSKTNQNVAFQNIGGIGNVTYIPQNAKLEDVIAFDTGPGNMLIDQAMQVLYQLSYDEDGKIAQTGKIDEEVLHLLMKDEYILRPYPKTTGREKYNMSFLNSILTLMDKKKKEDIIATITAYTADSIAYAYQTLLPKVDKVIVSGGGAHNLNIVQRLKEKLQIPVEIYEQSDSYEAYCFAILGHYAWMHQPSNLRKVTNAKEDVVLGKFTYPPRKKEKDEE